MSDAIAIKASPIAVRVNTPGGHLAFTGNETPEQRQAAISEAYGVKSEAPAPATMPTQLHWDANRQAVAGSEAATARTEAPGPVKAAPPSTTPTHANASVAAKVEALTRNYRALKESERTEAATEAYTLALKLVYDGDPGAPAAPAAPVAAPAAQPVAAPAPASDAATNAALDVATRGSNQYGWAKASAITGPLLHGYTIPQDREYNVAELVAGLRQARQIGLTQAQVDAYIKGGA